MFDNLKNKLRWNEILNNPTTPSYMASVIKEIMLPYGISAHKYQINKECIDNVCKYSRNGDSATPSVIATVSDLNYKYSCIRHSSMPLWYYYAFPDVFLWTISDEGNTQKNADSDTNVHNKHCIRDSRHLFCKHLQIRFRNSCYKSNNKANENRK